MAAHSVFATKNWINEYTMNGRMGFLNEYYNDWPTDQINVLLVTLLSTPTKSKRISDSNH